MFSVLNRLFRTESFRLTAIFVALIAGAMLILMVLIYATVHQALRADLLDAARSDLASIQKGYDAEGASEAQEVIEQLLFKAGTSKFFVLQTANGHKLTGNLPPMPTKVGTQIFPVPKLLLEDSASANEHVVLGMGAMLAPTVYAFAGRDLYLAQETEEQILRTFGWVLAATLLLALLGGIILSQSFLGRMDAITRTCQAIMAGRLSQRIPERGTRDEFDQLVRTINSMLDRISALMENIQQISGDIAHDLRTPLTRLRHKLELARSEATDVEQYALAMEYAIEESDRILMTFSSLLRIGQIESGANAPPFEPIDLSALLKELAEIYQPVAEDAHHTLRSNIEPNITASGERNLLSQVFVNLIENAITHTPSDTKIVVGLKKVDDQIIAWVDDSGLGIPASEHKRVFRRFYRLEPSRSIPGSGLGLSLVAAIVRFHGAQIELTDNQPGLRVSIIFLPMRSTSVTRASTSSS
jgi:signal transduction histidine kinase